MAKKVVLVLGVIFVLAGLLGHFNNPIFGIFPVNGLHNLIHLATGVLAIIFAMQGNDSARGFAKTFGIIYLLVAILGFIQALGFLNSNGMADNLLHLVLAIILLIAGYSGESGSSAPSSQGM